MVAAVIAASFAADGALAQGTGVCLAGAPNAPAVYIDSTASDVTVRTTDGRELAAARNQLLCPGDEVRTGETGRVTIRFDEKRTIIRLDGNSRTRVLTGGTGTADVSLLSGVLYFISSVRRYFEVETPYVVAGIDGTEALVSVQPSQQAAIAAVREGLVKAYDRAQGPSSTIAVPTGDAAFRSATVPFQSAPISELPPPFSALLIVSDSAVDWAIYYPPILFVRDARDEAVRAALLLLASGDYDRADGALDRAPDASLPAVASLRAIIAIARNRLDEGRRWVAFALQADPTYAPAHVAASYLDQAVGDLNGALSDAQEAENLDPDDAYVVARVAELHMTIGDRSAALRSAERALALERTPLALFVAGLARLTNWEYGRAEALFDEAIALDPQAPLPRLGLGLLLIRRGRTAAGAWEIEKAVAHDPSRASLRTWLGRAYFEEELTAKAAEQFRLAKEADPEDPTPYLFSALERYAANQPIAALGELLAAEKRGDARGVVRSQRGLAEDTATRGAALGRIYDVLGFEQLAIVEGAEAVDADPANPGAHRFLAEVYRARPGQEIAQTSELLRSQLLSRPSKTPVQPQLAETGLALLDTSGPTQVSFAEFSPLFDSDGLRLDISGLGGTQATWAGEASATVLHRGFSASVGAFHYETQGFHPNNQVEHDVLNAISTLSVAPWLDLFGEYRWRRTEAGDRRVLFDMSTFSETVQIEFEREVARVGFHAMPGVGHDVLGLASHGTLETGSSEELFPFTSVTDTEETIKEGQLQYIGQMGPHSIQVGGAISEVEGDEAVGFLSPFGNFITVTPIDVTQGNVYGYGIIRLPETLEWTLGVSFDQVDRDGSYDITTVNPKLGVRWSPADYVTLRAVYLSTLKRRLVADQTLEPTTVAGFNQFFDTFNGSVAERLGVGVDVKVTDALWLGGEATEDAIVAPAGAGRADESRLRGYVNATVGEHLAVSVEPAWERLTSDILFVLDEVETLEVPMTVRVFNDAGLFGSARGTYVFQDGSDAAVGFDDEFFVVDAALGYRFPNQRGVVSIEARNVLDSNFGFAERILIQDFTAEPRFAPERTITGRASLKF